MVVTLDKIIELERDTAKIQVYTAQVRMLTELFTIAKSGGDIRSKLRQYIADKEKELGI